MAKKYKSIEIQGWINNQTFSAWFNRLYSMALATFEWTGLPSTVDPRFLEMVLFWRGFGVYFADEVIPFSGRRSAITTPANSFQMKIVC